MWVIGYLANSKSVVTEPETKELHEAARALGVELRVLNAANESEIDTAFATLRTDRHPAGRLASLPSRPYLPRAQPTFGP
jgi:hypothetical protein